MIHLLQAIVLRALLTAMIALRALRRNKLRTILTALGIIIGVASVVAMVAVGNGAQARIESQVSALGQNLLTVFAGSRRSGGVNSGLGSASTITLADADAIGREVPDVAAVSPEVTSTAQAIANGRNWSTTIVGESPDYLKIRDWKLATGSMFTDREVRSAAKVAVIGSKTAHELFGPLNPVGQTVRVKNIPFVIIGLLDQQGRGHGRPESGRPHCHSLHHRHETHHRRQIPALHQPPNRQRRPHGRRPATNHQPPPPAPPPLRRPRRRLQHHQPKGNRRHRQFHLHRSSPCCWGPSRACRSWSAASAS